MSESENDRRQREGKSEAIRVGDDHMDRVDMWAEGLSGVEDHAERRVRLRGMARHAELAAHAYASASFPWGVAMAEVSRGYAFADLAALEQGDSREQLLQAATASCGQAIDYADRAGHVRLGAAAALLMACGEVLAQVHVLHEGDPAAQRILEEDMAKLGEAAAEALAWENTLHQEGDELAWLAETAEAVADLETDPQAKLQAAASFHALANEAAASLWQTLDTEGSDEAIALLHKARAVHASAQSAASRAGQSCPRCGAANGPDQAYCTACGASLVVGQATILAPRAPGGDLVIVDGPTAGQRCPLRDGLRIGRAADNDLALGESLVSRHHAEVRQTATGHEIVDLGSSNGTDVNGARIDGPTLLTDGDTIAIGGVALRVELSPARVCPSCGAALKPGRTFCTRCGARVA
jgi:hypothetical protein